jgi:hypothetical protein
LEPTQEICTTGQAWWLTPVIPTFMRWKNVGYWARGNQTGRLCLKKRKEKDNIDFILPEIGLKRGIKEST